MATFANVGESLELLTADRGEDVLVTIADTYEMDIDLQRELGSFGSGAWQTVKRYDEEDATVSDTYVTKRVDENLRLFLARDGGGSATVTLTSSSDLIKKIFTDGVGNNLMTLRQSGATIDGTLTVDGATTLTGAITSAVTMSGVTTLTGNDLAVTAGVGITGAAEVFASGVERIGTLIKTTIWINITGLNSAATDDDIIGDNGTGVAHLGQITAAVNGTIFEGSVTCHELPATGDPNIAVWEAVEATGVEDTLITALTATELMQSQGDGTDWVAGDVIRFATFPTANEYLYLVQGDATGTDGTYTAGIFEIVFWGT